MLDLNGKVAVVTGAGHGIGREIALTLARAGSDVAVTDIADSVFLVAKEIEAMPKKGLAVKCDISDLEQVKNLKNQVLEHFQKIDILVNNAGIYPQKPFLEMTEADWNKVINVNLNGTFHCTKEVLPGMVERKYGKIVNLTSIAGTTVGFINLVHYSASKAAIAGFTKSLALEVAPHGVNVNAVAPGPIDVGDAMHGNQEVMSQIIKMIPAGRMGKPADIADLVLFLASDQASFITGQCIVSDGGYTLP